MRIKKGIWWKWLLAAILAVHLWGPSGVFAAPPQGVLKQATHISISADWLDPATGGYTVSAYIPLYLFHDALVKAMPEGLYAPSLAESWTISPDSKQYEFKLRKGVQFHNGDALTAEDVVFSFWRYKAAQAKFLHDKTEKVVAVDPHLVRFQFKEPFPDFLDYLIPGGTTIGWIVPKKYLERVGDAGFKKHPVGAGPYKFVEFVSGLKLVGEAFEQYWRKVPNIKRIEFLIVLEPATRLAMVKRGEADIATLMTDVFYQNVKKDPSLRLVTPLSPSRNYLYITSQWDPKSPWSDARVRKAASLAIDRRTLVDIHYTGGEPIGSMGPETDPVTVKFPADPYDPDQARRLLSEAGYPKGFHGGAFYPLGGFWPYGEQIVNYWKTIGITVDTILLERPAWMAARGGGKMKGGSFPDPVQAANTAGFLSYLLGSTSYGKYPEIETLWGQYTKAVDPKIRKAMIERVQRLIYEKTVFIPLNSIASPSAFGPRVKGNPYRIQPHIWFTAPYEDIELAQ